MENNDDVDAQRRREECERKARRGEMDPRLEFAFQMLIDGTGLPRHQIMDHIFEGDMVSGTLQLIRPFLMVLLIFKFNACSNASSNKYIIKKRLPNRLLYDVTFKK